jgi:hypothetical protein
VKDGSETDKSSSKGDNKQTGRDIVPHQCPNCTVIARKTNISDLMSGMGDGPYQVCQCDHDISVNFHYQQRDNFWNIQEENTMWIGAVICVWHFTLHLFPGTPLCRYQLHLSIGKMYIHTYIYMYIHTFHGSISVSRRQYDMEQVKST